MSPSLSISMWHPLQDECYLPGLKIDDVLLKIVKSMTEDNSSFDQNELPHFPFGDAAPAKVKSRKTFEDLGVVRHEMHQDRQNLVAGIIISLLLIGGGLWLLFLSVMDIQRAGGQLPWMADRGPDWLKVPIALLSCAGLVIGGAGILWLMIANWSLGIQVCELGFAWHTARKTTKYYWKDLESVDEEWFEERLPLLKGPMKYAVPTQKARMGGLRFKDGTEIPLDANTIPGFGKLIAAAQAQVRQRDNKRSN